MLAARTHLDWSDVLTTENVEWRACVRRLMVEAEARRPLAKYDTGSITEDEAYALLSLASLIHAAVVIEVGTFIGTSTTALAAAWSVYEVWTCDISNDCLPRSRGINTAPFISSTDMLRGVAAYRVSADLCFFDGTLSKEDAELLAKVTHDQTVYAFHDYNYGPKIRKGGRHEIMPRKGIGNVQLLQPRLPNHKLIEPFEGSTLALLVPKESA